MQYSLYDEIMKNEEIMQKPISVAVGGKKTRHYNKKISRNYRIKKNKTKRRNNKTRKS